MQLRLQELLAAHRYSSDRPPARNSKDVCPRVTMVVPSLGKRCGIAEYSKTLCQSLQKMNCEVKLLGGPLSNLQPADLLEMPIVHFQYEYSLYDSKQLEALCRLLTAQGVQLLLTLHSYTDDAISHNLLLQRLFPRVIVHAAHTGELLRKKGWTQELSIIPMGIPDVSPPEQEGIGNSIKVGPRPAIGFFGFMHWHKGILPLVQAVKQLRATIYPHARCYLWSGINENASSGEFCSYFTRQIKDLGLQDVIDLRLDFLPEQQLISCLKAMDVNVLPYTECGYNSTSAAARLLMAARRPIITSDIPFFADLDEQVVKIPEVTPAEIFRALYWLLGRPAIQDDLVRRLDRYVRENTWEACAAKHRQIYLDLIQDLGQPGTVPQSCDDLKAAEAGRLAIIKPHPDHGAPELTGSPSVSALYVVKNEDEYLPFSIRSIYDAVQEIVVVDNGSTDRTVESITGFDKVKLFFSEETSFCNLRNFALSKTTGDWVLIVDGDEVFYDGLKDRLDTLIRDETVDAYTCWFYQLMKSYYYMQNHGDCDPIFKKIHIIRNVPGLHYEGAVHERPVIGPRIKDSGIHYVHYGYTKPPESILEKFKLYDRLQGRPAGHYDRMDPDDLLKGRPLWPFRKEHPPVIRSYIEQKAILLASQGAKLYRKPPEEPDEDCRW
jgi:glycosyltransferase involved in cell wall biosynthesis